MTLINRAVLVGLTFVALYPASARAQMFGVGASLGWVAAPEPSVHARPRVGPLIRLGESRDGWGTRIGFNWYAADLDATVGGESREFGRLRVRPIMVGYGYTKVLGPVAGSANLLAGYAFTSFAIGSAFENAYRDLRGVGRVTSDVSNTFVLKPEVSAWIDISPKISLNMGIGYMVARPAINLTSTAGLERFPIRADVVMFKVGAVYSVF